jgi:hypothetical protein
MAVEGDDYEDNDHITKQNLEQVPRRDKNFRL